MEDLAEKFIIISFEIFQVLYPSFVLNLVGRESARVGGVYYDERNGGGAYQCDRQMCLV